MVWLNFILGLDFIFLCIIILHNHTQKQRKRNENLTIIDDKIEWQHISLLDVLLEQLLMWF